MKINNLQHLLLSKNSNNNNIGNKLQSNHSNSKTCDTASQQCSANYNIAFSGIFKHKNNDKNDYIKADNISEKVRMLPDTEYLVSENTIFSLDGNEVSLNDKNIKGIIKRLPKNSEFIIGRETTPFLNFSRTVSRQHLKIRKDNKGRLFAKDLWSLNGTDILPNLIIPTDTKKDFTLEQGKRYLLPKRSVLSLGGVIFELNKYNELLDNLKNGESVTVGRDSDADIVVKWGTISRQHLRITKADDGYIVKDLGSTNGTDFLCVDDTELF